MWVRLCIRSSSALIPSGHFLVRGARPSSTSSSSVKGESVKLSPLTGSFPGSSTSCSTFVLGFTAIRLGIESWLSLKFLILGLMGGTQTSSGPSLGGERLWRRRAFSSPGTRPLNSPADEHSRDARVLGCLHLSSRGQARKYPPCVRSTCSLQTHKS